MISYFIIQDLSLSSVPKKIVGEGGENIQCQGYYQHHTAKKKNDALGGICAHLELSHC